ncbi:MAG: hypothetical protein WBG71_01470 [Leeuwenhoekiella sp.]
MAFLKLIRYRELLLIAGLLTLVHYGFLEVLKIPVGLSDLGLLLLIFATLCIAAAGHIIFKLEAGSPHQISRPNRQIIKGITEKKAFNLYLFLNVVGVVLGYYLSISAGTRVYAAVFVFVSALIYTYANSLHKIVVVGNLLKAIIRITPLVTLMLFDLAAIYEGREALLRQPVDVLIDYSVFLFLILLLRNLVRDIVKVDTAYLHGNKSIPTEFGKERTAKVVAVFALILVAGIGVYTYAYFSENKVMAGYFLFAMGLPLLVIAAKAWAAKGKVDYIKLSNWMDGILFVAALCLLVLSFSLNFRK